MYRPTKMYIHLRPCCVHQLSNGIEKAEVWKKINIYLKIVKLSTAYQVLYIFGIQADNTMKLHFQKADVENNKNNLPKIQTSQSPLTLDDLDFKFLGSYYFLCSPKVVVFLLFWCLVFVVVMGRGVGRGFLFVCWLVGGGGLGFCVCWFFFFSAGKFIFN